VRWISWLTIAQLKESLVTHALTIGQFSHSPVLAAAEHLGLLAKLDLQISTKKVVSSPGQYEWLRDGEIDIAITSPDNVLLYATTDKNPISEQLDITMLRAIDRGLGLSLVTRPNLDLTNPETTIRMGVDVMRSGFAFLLRSMLTSLGVAPEQLEFAEVGSTPTRKGLLLAGEIDGTILNAESVVEASAAGMRVWSSSADISENYLGTVIAVGPGFDPQLAADFLQVWAESTAWLLDAPAAEVSAALGKVDPRLGTPEYLEILRNPLIGLLRDPTISVEELQILCAIREGSGAYVPAQADLERLAAG
jgi:ABC-type nitrate/sulfonate/bicarbonate transport system substrate-binding protein